MTYVLAAVSGVIAGLLSGLLGVGGGVVLVPIFVYLFKMDIHLAVGTSLAVIVPTAIMGALKHFGRGYVDVKVFLIVSLFAVIGAFWGAAFSLGMAAPVLKKTFAAFLFVLSIYMYFRD